MLNAKCAGEYEIEEINIEQDPSLIASYSLEIPVITINGIKAFKYRLTAAEFRRKVLRANSLRED